MEGKITKEGKELQILKVVLDMSQGAFTVENIDISDEEKVDLNAAIKAYFSENPVVYLINALDLTSVPVIDGLKPKGFLFRCCARQPTWTSFSCSSRPATGPCSTPR